MLTKLAQAVHIAGLKTTKDDPDKLETVGIQLDILVLTVQYDPVAADGGLDRQPGCS